MSVMEDLVFGVGHEKCPITGRPYEVGIGSASKDRQTANFIADRDASLDRPKEGERCPQTGREFEVGSGSLSKAAQTARFLSEQTPAEKAQRVAAFEALNAAEPAGKA
jgi:hypothetical protein